MASPGDPGGVGARRPTSSVRKPSDEAPRPARPVSISPPCAREGRSSRRSSGKASFREYRTLDVFSPRVRLSRPPSASTPRSSASAHGLPSPGEHRDLRTVPGSWATGESRGLSTRISREGCSSGRSDRSPLPPPAPAGSVRCWRRAGLPRAVMRVCKEKCAIPDLEESVALNSLVPYDMKHTIRV